MKTRIIGLSAAVAAAALTGFAAQTRAGGDKVAFPANYDKGVLYTTVDRADNKQYRELYVTPAAAVEAAKKGAPLPDGTVLTLVQYRAVLGADGNPTKDANGRFSKGDIVGYTVMEKRAGWGAEYPPAKAVNDKANLTACFQCHKPLDKQDFVFSYDKLQAHKGM